ncbi:hypothetical protein FB45DRAFT_1086079, partial [Roridomyces roridus]
FVRSPDVWFDDGTIILQAENTLFRAYRGVLAAQSSIFRDTFSIPQPEEQETFDGCLVVKVHDSAPDFRLFLLATHDAGYLTTHPADGMETLARLLRLATKYDVEHIRIRMSSILSTIYPSTLAGWLARSTTPGYETAEGQDLLALSLATEHALLPVLPGVYLAACGYRHSFIVASGVIDLKAKTTCMTAQENFELLWARSLFYGLYHGPDDNSCQDATNGFECDRARLEFLGRDGLPGLEGVFPCAIAWDDLEVCNPCKASAQNKFNEASERLWNHLPSLFSLPEWEVL